MSRTGRRWGVVLARPALVVWLSSSPVGAQVHKVALPSASAELEQASRSLLGAPYLLSPLGEGSGFDPDPRFRRDAFDCTTFVETVVGLALFQRLDSKGLLEPVDVLDRLRYSGAPSYENRLHFITAQWLPFWRGLGLIEDLTGATYASLEVDGDAPRATISVDLDSWRARRIATELDLAEEQVPLGIFELAYVPVELAVEAIELAPSGTLLNVVRRPTKGRPILVSHQALVLDQPGRERVVRHASTAVGRVADQTPEQFVRVLRQPKSWPVLGVNLQRLSLPPSFSLADD